MTLESRLLHLPHIARYAVSAVSHLAGRPDRGYRMVGDIAKATGLPTSYLAKVLQRLAHSGLLESRPGVKGGYRLAAPPESITLSSVITHAHAASVTPKPCMIEVRDCDSRRPCTLHPLVKDVESALWERLRSLSLAEYSRRRRSLTKKP